jgi:2-polyprenyl-3-methyl-5-hydroxy-6-metoxy-1,4-benzoquinol methylase
MSNIDLDGEQILESIAVADKFNYWMYSKMKPWSNAKTLEIGSGIGNISQFFIQDNKQIVLSDLREQYTQNLKEKFSNNEVIQLDLVDPNFENTYADHLEQYDFVFALNVVEHIKDDKKALTNIYKLLKPGGYSFILVPAYQFLFNNFDVTLEHFRRYNRKTLESIIPQQMKKIKTSNFNFAGIFGWFFVGNILKKKTIPESNMKLYNVLVPIFKIVDFLVLNRIGLSVINISQK